MSETKEKVAQAGKEISEAVTDDITAAKDAIASEIPPPPNTEPDLAQKTLAEVGSVPADASATNSPPGLMGQAGEKAKQGYDYARGTVQSVGSTISGITSQVGEKAKQGYGYARDTVQSMGSMVSGAASQAMGKVSDGYEYAKQTVQGVGSKASGAATAATDAAVDATSQAAEQVQETVQSAKD